MGNTEEKDKYSKALRHGLLYFNAGRNCCTG